MCADLTSTICKDFKALTVSYLFVLPDRVSTCGKIMFR